jgi:hypothetical protein
MVSPIISGRAFMPLNLSRYNLKAVALRGTCNFIALHCRILKVKTPRMGNITPTLKSKKKIPLQRNVIITKTAKAIQGLLIKF